MHLPIDLVCEVLRYVSKPEGYVLLKYGFSPTRQEHKRAKHVLGITEQDAAEGLAQVSKAQRLQRLLERAHQPISLERVLCVAASHGQLLCMEIARNRGADNFARPFMVAARVGQTSASVNFACMAPRASSSELGQRLATGPVLRRGPQ